MEYESIEYINSDSENTNCKCGEIFSSDGVEFQISCILCDTLNDQQFFSPDEYVEHMKFMHLDSFKNSLSVDEDENLVREYEIACEDDMNDTMQPDEKFVSNCYKLNEDDEIQDFRDDKLSEKDVCQVIENASEVLVELSIDSATDKSVTTNIEAIDCSDQSEQENSSSSTVQRRRRKQTIVICEVCGKSFRGAANLKYHMFTHTENNPYECDICGKSYRFPHNLLKHKQKHTNAKPFKCEYCGKLYSSKDGLSNHETKHTGDPKKYKCNYCNKSFSTPGLLVEHRRIHTGEKPYKCEFCDESFISKQVMVHRHTPCPKYMQLPIQCQHCSLRFKTEDELLSQHKECSKNGNLSQRLQLHKCPQCPAELISKQALSNHKKCHNGEESFCDKCGKRFANRILLANHLKVHNHPYKCQQCDKGFSTEKCFIKHNEYFHNRVRPFLCVVCQKTFITQCALSKHTILHSQNKRFQCNKCQKKFVNYESLYSHKKSHADRKPCKLCGKILNVLYMKNHKCNFKQSIQMFADNMNL